MGRITDIAENHNNIVRKLTVPLYPRDRLANRPSSDPKAPCTCTRRNLFAHRETFFLERNLNISLYLTTLFDTSEAQPFKSWDISRLNTYTLF